MSSATDFLYEETCRVPVLSDPSKTLSLVLTVPPAVHADHFTNGLGPATNRLAVLLHGLGSHKNFGFNPGLASALSREYGLYTARFDFRGCGDSSKCGKDGRTIDEDVEDLDSVVEYFQSGGHRGIKLAVELICAHSRGVVVMFNWTLQRQQLGKPLVYTLINCCGRFDGKGMQKRVERNHPDYKEKGGYYLSGYVEGKYRDVWIPTTEVMSTSAQDMNKLKGLDKMVQVLNIYGSEDEVIPPEDKYMYHEVLGQRSDLSIIEQAGHNFYGLTVYDNLESTEYTLGDGTVTINGTTYPLHRRRKVIDYTGEFRQRVLQWLSPQQSCERFYRNTLYIDAHTPRWVEVEGIANFRDLGGWCVGATKRVRPRLMFRCANPTNVTAKGRKTLEELNIRAIFDLRSAEEREEYGHLELAHATNFHIPAFDSNLSPSQATSHYLYLLTCWSTYLQVYKDVLATGTGAFRTIFEYLRDNPGCPILFHCTAGKDRTGVVGMLLLLLAGVDPWIIAREYELTTIGLRPDHEHIRAKFYTALEKMSDTRVKQQLFETVARGRENFSVHEDGFRNLISSRYEALRATIEWVDEKYGGVERYLREEVGIEDLELVRAQIVENMAVQG
ncbi:hypothetical protein KL938_001841 [Ogataea parapolymorpha]|nr:hypothetical protein KL938_001841 [Ogataea parapolymorpha]